MFKVKLNARGCVWQGADKSGCHFCAPIAAIGKSGVKLVSLPLWFHAQRHGAAPSSRREEKKGIPET